MAKTISFHNGSTWSRGHNVRDKRFVKAQTHIDNALSKNNEIIVDEVVRKAYDRIFGEAVAEYNLKQTRSDRKIENYYEKIKKDKKKHVVYECIVQIGDKDDTGNNAPTEKAALRQFAENWKKRNPRLEMIGAYIHADEPDGTVHLHIDYIPVAECSRGMALQNSLDRALQQQGFKTENIKQTAQIAWQDSERKALVEICKEMNIDVQKTSGAVTQGRQHLSKPEYQKLKEDAKRGMDLALISYQNAVNEFLQAEPKKPIESQSVPTAARLLVGKENKDKLLLSPSEIEKLREKAKAIEVMSAANEQRKLELSDRSADLFEQQRQFDEARIAERKREQIAKEEIRQEREKAAAEKKAADEYAAQMREFYAERFPYVQQILDEKKALSESLRESVKGRHQDMDNFCREREELRKEIAKKAERINELNREISALQSLQKKNEEFSERVRVLENVLKEKENALTECCEEIRELAEKLNVAEELYDKAYEVGEYVCNKTGIDMEKIFQKRLDGYSLSHIFGEDNGRGAR